MRGCFLVVVAAAAALVGASAVARAAEAPAAKVITAKVVFAKDIGIGVRDAEGHGLTVAVDAKTQITFDGKAAKAEALPAGAGVTITVRPGSEEGPPGGPVMVVKADKIEAKPAAPSKPVVGKVLFATDSGIGVSGEKGPGTTVRVDGKTQVTLDGKAVKAEALPKGAVVTVTVRPGTEDGPPGGPVMEVTADKVEAKAPAK